ncbi:hypothetical protein BpHYR1_014578 [Brachionus plicatilis]|uniref:Uncharacterized protein n=1 Tax=Brachionus plicatilis TaxID=10195 RepID=A0A3M7RMD9_BRAPC|nr:hypothetical protein BpHYR1_014578 [Brachionus plicatilis]
MVMFFFGIDWSASLFCFRSRFFCGDASSLILESESDLSQLLMPKSDIFYVSLGCLDKAFAID